MSEIRRDSSELLSNLSYDASIDLSPYNSASNRYTTQKAGMIYASANASNSHCIIYTDKSYHAIASGAQGPTSSAMSSSVLVPKGTKLYVSKTSVPSGYETARFYPFSTAD